MELNRRKSMSVFSYFYRRTPRRKDFPGLLGCGFLKAGDTSVFCAPPIPRRLAVQVKSRTDPAASAQDACCRSSVPAPHGAHCMIRLFRFEEAPVSSEPRLCPVPLSVNRRPRLNPVHQPRNPQWVAILQRFRQPRVRVVLVAHRAQETVDGQGAHRGAAGVEVAGYGPPWTIASQTSTPVG